MKEQIDVLVVMIPSEEESQLDLFLGSLGWDKEKRYMLENINFIGG